ncbi:hypothetical protein ACQEVB_40405 [Pseudonocardia sp. CA-107938]|uniref:hypothetical protein n=1 Tax=Pseudonocardia sp. CA-107938 TaxID=3240021 RepID=UPI003D94FCB9
MNRIALHQSVVLPMDPVRQVALAGAAGVESIGLRVAAVADEQEWWSKGLGSPMLRDLIEALLASRVTVLDVGSVELGPDLHVIDGREAYVRALEIGVRIGAQYVTARAGRGDPTTLFAVLAELAQHYQLRALMTPTPGTAVATLADAARVVGDTGGGVVVDVDPHADDDAAEALADTIADLGPLVGYVRIGARALAAGPPRPGLLATLPPQVAVAIGAAPADVPGTAGPVDSDHVARVTALRAAVDTLLRHPRAEVTR